jgi:AcrR family transcriptional regulator
MRGYGRRPMAATKTPKKKTSVAKKPAGAYHHGDLRSALLAAAWEIVDRQGTEALTTRALAARVGVSHAAPAHHFADKSALLLALAAEATNRLAAAVSGSLKEARGKERLRAAAVAYTKFALAHPATFRLLAAHPAKSDAALAEASGRLFAAIAEATAGSPSGAIDGKTFAAWASLHGAACLALDSFVRKDLPKSGQEKAILALVENIGK